MGSWTCDPAGEGAWTGPAASELNWCGPGTVSKADGTGCTPCPAGFWRPGGDASPVSNACMRVAPGWMASNSSGATSISLCGVGTISFWSSTDDTLWQDGTVLPASTRTPADPTQCSPCTGNTAAPQTGSTSCMVCPSGSYVLTTSTTPPLNVDCKLCPANFYRDYNDPSPRCSKCPPGSETGTSAGASDCTLCVPGFVNPSQTDAPSFFEPGTGAASYYSQPPDGALGVSTSCLPW